MRRLNKLWFIVLVSAILGLPSSAHAQTQFRTFRGGNFGTFGGFGFRNFGNAGDFVFPGGFAGWPGFAGSPGFAGWPGFAAPFGGMPFVTSNYFNSGWNSPYSPYDYYRYEPLLVPGFGASEPVHSRPTFYPAIVEPSRQVIEAALEVDDNRARIDMRVPTANAQVYLDGVPAKQTGIRRMFVTPQLKPGTRYFLSVEVVWRSDDGRSRTSSRQLNLRAGETASLNLQEAD